jgi:hypothetical protein
MGLRTIQIWKNLLTRLRMCPRNYETCEDSISYEVRLAELMSWLARAQDATPDNGVAQAYFFREKRWASSYPETTGYIIPTFFEYARLTGKSEFTERALRMADWECVIQLPEGGIQASTIDAHKVQPTVFNTGMVIFGWVTAYRETGYEKYLRSAQKAASWLMSIQDSDGAWRKFGSLVTATTVNTYNTRVAWSLLELNRVAPDMTLVTSAKRNLDWALKQQRPNGWLSNNCLLDNAQPYTHTIAYAMRGFLEAGDILRDERYVNAAIKIFGGIRPHIGAVGFLAGRFDAEWNPTVRYCCLTGNAQLAINAFRLCETKGENLHADAQKLLDFVLGVQNLSSDDINRKGAIPGSSPVSGGYHPYQYPNWAAKFTADAIMKYFTSSK